MSSKYNRTNCISYFNKQCLLLKLLYISMGIQIIISGIWFFLNIGNVPTFGDTSEYLALSQTLVTDEYRTILYPLILHCIIKLADIFNIPYTCILYPIQIIVGILSCFLFVYNIYDVFSSNKKIKKLVSLFFALYLNGIPIILFMHCSVLTDSLAFSMLMFTISALSSLIKRIEIKYILLLFISFLFQILLRADRIYNMSLMIAIFILYAIIKKQTQIKTAIVCTICIAVAIACSFNINHKYQSPGLYGRIKTTPGFILLDRVVWPHMEKNYDYFSNDIKSILSIEDAKTFDQHNNNVMYITAPLIIDKIGGAQAEITFIDMAKTVLHHDPLSVISRTTMDFLNFYITPASTFLDYIDYHLFKKSHTNFQWNLICVSSQYPIYSHIIYVYSALMNFILLLCILPLYLRFKKIFKLKYFIHIFPILLSTLLISIWFALGDGAPANNRYMLISYVFYSTIGIILLTEYNNRKQEIKDERL